jgi:hypothetical protein
MAMGDDIISKSVIVSEGEAEVAFDGRILLAVLSMTGGTPREVGVKIGSVGIENKYVNLRLGEFTVFERTSDEIYEVGYMGGTSVAARFLISCINPSLIVGNMSRLNERIIWDSEDSKSRKFSQEEKEYMNAKLLLFEKQVTDNYAKSEELKRFVHDKISYLIQSLDRQTKMDWFYTSLGIFTSIAMQVGVSAANDDKFWLLIKAVLGIPVELLFGNLLPLKG